jgi:radical SAM-linked protein
VIADTPDTLGAACRSAPADGAPPRFRVIAEMTVSGDVRFLSHHDELRMLARAVIRARWPIAYSQGYNPLPKLVLPLPRAVGIAADSQLLLVDLTEPRTPQALHEALRVELPAGYESRRIIAPAPRSTPHPQAVRYAVTVAPQDAVALEQHLPELLSADRRVVHRTYGPGKPTRDIDIRPFIGELALEGTRLSLCLRYVAQRTARPGEVLTELGLATDAYHHDLRRGEIQWDMQFAGPAYGPARHERKTSGQDNHNQEEDYHA